MVPCERDILLPSVPRSRGCINCVTRKTRCDGRQPTCKACQDRMQVCRGYRRKEFIFLNDGWRAPGVASQPRPQKARTRQGRESTSTIISSGAEEEPSHDSIVLSRTIAPDPMQIYVSFFLSQFTSDLPREGYFLHKNLRRCLALLLNKPVLSTNIDPCPNPVIDASEALVKSHFGRLNGSSRLLRESVRLYTSALRSLSVKLDEVQCVGIPSMAEEDWMDLVSSCLMLVFWELAMNPNSTSWQNHVRGLASVIEGRGPEGLRSSGSLEVIAALRMPILLESISSKRPTFLSQQKWQSFQGFRFPSPTLHSMEGPKHYLDFVVDRLITTSTIMADFDKLRQNGFRDSRGLRLDRLKDMQSEGLEVLQQMETVLAHLQTNIGTFSKVPQSRFTPGKVDLTRNSMCHGLGGFVPKCAPPFGKLVVYNLTSLCRTAAMSLRLLMCDLIDSQGGADPGFLEERRAALMVHVEAVLNSISYSSQQEIFGVAPFCLVAAFRMAKAVLERVCEMLRAEFGKETELERCIIMKELVQRHLDFVASKKISIKVDY